jgi:hypothetical protein
MAELARGRNNAAGGAGMRATTTAGARPAGVAGTECNCSHVTRPFCVDFVVLLLVIEDADDNGGRASRRRCRYGVQL